MTTEDTSAALRVENARLHAEVAAAQETSAALRAQVAALLERVTTLEGQRATDSHSSSKPPSSDGPTRLPRSLRGKSGKKPGGQPEHRGASLRLVAAPDRVVVGRPAVCPACATPLADGMVDGVERRQVIDVPPVRAVVTEYRRLHGRCLHCQALVADSFPAPVTAPVQYGPRLRALAVYRTHQQLLPYGRARAVSRDLLGCPVAEGTLAALAQEASERLAPTEERIAAALRAGAVLHNDETSLAVQGRRWWLHTASTNGQYDPLDPRRGPSPPGHGGNRCHRDSARLRRDERA